MTGRIPLGLEGWRGDWDISCCAAITALSPSPGIPLPILKVALPALLQPQPSLPSLFILLHRHSLFLSARLVSLLLIINFLMMLPAKPLSCGLSPFTGHFYSWDAPQPRTQYSQTWPHFLGHDWSSGPSSWVNMTSRITKAHQDLSLSQNLSSSYPCTV